MRLLTAPTRRSSGYNAIELRVIPITLDPPPPEGVFSELELEAMRTIEAPFVNPEKCVGCGICEYRCHTKYVVQEKRLYKRAIVIVAENEHRPMARALTPGRSGSSRGIRD